MSQVLLPHKRPSSSEPLKSGSDHNLQQLHITVWVKSEFPFERLGWHGWYGVTFTGNNSKTATVWRNLLFMISRTWMLLRVLCSWSGQEFFSSKNNLIIPVSAGSFSFIKNFLLSWNASLCSVRVCHFHFLCERWWEPASWWQLPRASISQKLGFFSSDFLSPCLRKANTLTTLSVTLPAGHNFGFVVSVAAVDVCMRVFRCMCVSVFVGRKCVCLFVCRGAWFSMLH